MANPLPIKITELDPLDSVANDDIFITVDRSDTANSLSGTTKRVTAQIFKDYVFSDFTAGSIDGLSDVSITSQEGDQLLKYNDIEQRWVNWTPNYLTSLPTASTSILGGVKIDGTSITMDSNGVISSSGGTGLQSRATAGGTLSNLVNNNTAEAGQLDIPNVAKTYALLKIQTSHAAWVTLYTSDTARDADASRTETTDPLPGSGVIAEIITSGAATQGITPGTLGWNDDATPTSTVYAKVVNKSGAQNSITVTLTYVELEG